MQELAARLGEPSSRPATEAALLEFLSTRRLEAEVVEALCIFWLATQSNHYIPDPNLAERVPKPSALSQLLLDHLGLSKGAPIIDLEKAPENFQIPQDFLDVQGVDLPRIFHTTMKNAERTSGAPLIRQMAFEWSTSRGAYPDAPFQVDIGHFSRSLGDSFVSLLSSRTALRMLSSYLRTLAAARKFWRMPPRMEEEMALLAMPLHPTLALIRPERPTWFPGQTDFDGDAQAIRTSVHALLERVHTARPGDELIAFASPVFMSMERCVEVSLVRWAQATGGSVGDESLAEHLGDLWTSGRLLRSIAQRPLSTTTTLKTPSLQTLVDGESRAWPLAQCLGMDRIGYLQCDLYPGRLFFPTMPGQESLDVAPQGGRLAVSSGHEVVADLCYWNAGWGPARPVQFEGNCGTALVSRGATYRTSGPAAPLGRSLYLWRVRMLQRMASYERFAEETVFGVHFV
ncbi:hypothetical protein D3C81_855240 [compost metagenome]